MPDSISPGPRIRNVLIVDDDPRNIRLIKTILQAEPYNLIAAQSATQALEILEAAKPDLVLLDIMIPGPMNGYDICRHIKSTSALRMTPVIMVTALSSPFDKIQALHAGADDFLSKPVDATEIVVRVRSLMRLQDLYRELERVTAQRLQFMAGVAHNIRSPLNALRLSMESLAEMLPAGNGTVAIWNNIQVCLDSIERLSDDVMNYYRIEVGDFILNYEACQVADILDTVRPVASPLAKHKNLTFTIQPPPLVELQADRHVVGQILLNLITNAIKYTPSRGTVEVRVYDLSKDGYRLPEGHYPVVEMLPESGVVFEISDSGHGIRPEDRARMFEEFERLDVPDSESRLSWLNVGGMGLGLPVSERLVKLHGGAIWFTSEPSKGSTFCFYIPSRNS